MTNPKVLRNGHDNDPDTPWRNLEKVDIAKATVGADITRLQRLLLHHDSLRHYDSCRSLANELQEKARQLSILYFRSAELVRERDGIIADPGKASKLKGFDYTRYSAFPD